MTFGQRFRELREKKGLTQMDIATKLNISISSVHKWENGRYPIADVLPALSKLLGASTDYLLGLTDLETVADKYIAATTREYVPVFKRVSSDTNILANAETLFTMPKLRNEDFDLIVKGNSMFPNFKDGELVLVRRQPRPDRDGQISLVSVNREEAVIKRFYQQPNGVLLRSENIDYEEIFIDRYKWESKCEFIGIVIGSVRLERE